MRRVEKDNTSFEVLKVASKEQLPKAYADPVSYGKVGLVEVFKSRYVFLCAFFASIGGLLFGYDQGVISIILVMEQFTTKIPEIDEASSFYKGFMTAMIELGAVIGAVNSSWIADKYSRKHCIAIATVWFVVGSVLQTAAQDYAMLVVGRFLGGVGIGAYSSTAPLYIGEISAPHLRGSLLSLEQFSIVFGIIVSYWITYGTRYMSGVWSWRLPFLIQLIPGMILGIGIMFLPYSPRWLVLTDQNEKSLKSLCTLRELPESHPMVQQEWLEIRASVMLQIESLHKEHPQLADEKLKRRFTKTEILQWLDLFKGTNFRRTRVGMLVMFFQQFTGINGLVYYSPTLFKALGFDYDLQLILGGVMNTVQILGVTLTFFITDSIGRRPVMLTGSFICMSTMIIVGALSGVFSDSWDTNKDKAYAAVVMIFIYMISFGASLGTLGWIMPSEVFPATLRAKGVAISTTTNWFSNFIVGLITPIMINKSSVAAYAFFAVFCLTCFVWSYFCLPETAGLTLEEIDKAFHDTKGSSDEKRKNEILEDLKKESGYSAVLE